MNILGVLWDYDGTIVNSANKNREVTIEVLKHFDSEITAHLPEALQSYETYQHANHTYKNWRELYTSCYGLREEQLDEAGSLWSPEQLKNKTVPMIFDGLNELMRKLKPIKMGICSQNGNQNIYETLKHYGIHDCFEAIIGYDDLAGKEQKPNPTGFIKCLMKLGILDEKQTEAPMIEESNVLIYIGDHSEDVVFGKNAQELLKQQNIEVICITIDYLQWNVANYKSWVIQPEYFVQSVGELERVLLEMIR